VNVLPALFLKEPATPDLDHIRRMVVGLIVLDGAVISALAAALFLGAGSRTDLLRLGFRGDDPAAQLRDGWRGFVAVALPMTIALMASQPLHNENSQHALLRLIRATGDPWDIGSVLLAAAVMAPLTEELLFRVTLQNWLAETLTPLHATLYTAALFAAVHGYRDALGIFVLAIVLGVVYQARRSYLAVVALHAIFNAYMTTATLVWPADGP
jgi:membrane protease YdiL (CAAX protease family)